MTAVLLGLGYLAVAAVGAGCWAFALAESRRRRQVVGWLVAAALTALAVRGLLAWLLAQQDFAFAQEKVVIGLPLSTAASVFAAVMWWMPRRAPSSRRDALTAGAFAAAATAAVVEIVLTAAVGAPAGVAAGVTAVVAVIGAGAVTALVRGGTTRRPAIAAGAASGLLVVGAVVVGFIGSTGAGALQAGGFGPLDAHAHGGAESGASTARSITDLTTAPTAVARVGETIPIELTAQQERIELPSGASIDAWTFGGLAGPAIVARVGDTLAVSVTNVDVEAGATVHWHGYPVANAFDGVAGVTQDAVRPGEEFGAEVLMTRPGTYWYHTHQKGSEGVVRGLYGTLVVQPEGGQVEDVDLTLAVHTFSGRVVLGTSDELESRVVAPGDSVRLRLVNTDQTPQTFAVNGAPFRVVALDGTDVATDPLEDRSLVIAAGGRVDVVLDMPDSAVRVGVASDRDGGLALVPKDGGESERLRIPELAFDPLGDLVANAVEPPGSSAIDAALAADGFDVERTVVLDRLPRFVDGMPNYAYAVDGRVYPYIDPTIVDEGDTVRLRLVNRSFETHPMHPHGHAVRVLSVDGREPTQPLWLDTFDVGPGEVWEVALYADNPGIWMDHCHNLEHAALGMVTHLAYRGYTSPFEHGGDAGNDPE
ncbi:MAG: multicopper oxidase family protein [Microbacterium sp.]